jgi:hypothetical protein
MEFNLKKSIIKKIVENKEGKRIEWDVTKDAEKPLVVNFSKEEMEYLKHACEIISEQQLPDEIWIVAEQIYNAAQD